MTDEMHAVRVHEYGDLSALQYEDAPRPEPANDEVLVEVHAAGVNPVDASARQGEVGDYSLPWIPGWDLSGVVEATGEDVMEFDIGTPVYGLVRFPDAGNAYAEYAAVPADEIVAKPATLDHTHAAGLPMVSLTAWQALFEKGNLSEGDRVLVHAAAGGVGHIAVQLAKSRGAHVIGTASGYNEEFLADLGVNEFVNYREERFEEEIDAVDLVVDAVGGETQERSFEVLKEGGTLASLLGDPSEDRADEYGVHDQRVGVQPNGDALAEISELVDVGDVTPTVDSTFPLTDAREAHEELEGEHARGKIVLQTETRET
jgi:NADPH:quinone reductase-like Zn-dependent oxidoreductase